MRAKLVQHINEVKQFKDPLDAMGVGIDAIIRKGAAKRFMNSLNWCAKIGRLDYMKYLLKSDYPIEKRNFNNALLIASDSGHLDIIKYLIEEKGADIHVDYDQSLGYVAQHGYLEIVKYLVEKGATIYDDKNHDYALHFALQNDHYEVLEYLIREKFKQQKKLKKQKTNES